MYRCVCMSIGCVCMYRVYIHARPGRCLCAYLYMCACISTCSVYICIYSEVFLYIHVSRCVHAYLHVHCVHICTYMYVSRHTDVYSVSGPVLSAGRVQVALPGGAGQAQCPLPHGCWFQGASPGELGLGKQNTGGAAPWNGASFPRALGSRCGSVSAEVGQQARNHAGR